MVAKYVFFFFFVVFLPIDPDQVQNHSPHNLHHKVSYIQITTCHRHIIRKPLFFFLVDENTVTTIPKLLFFSGVPKISCRSSMEKSHKLYQKLPQAVPRKRLWETSAPCTGVQSPQQATRRRCSANHSAAEAHSSGQARESCEVQSRLE